MITDLWFWFFSFIVGASVLIFMRLLYVEFAGPLKLKYGWVCPRCEREDAYTRFNTNNEHLLDLLVDEHLNWHNERRRNNG